MSSTESFFDRSRSRSRRRSSSQANKSANVSQKKHIRSLRDKHKKSRDNLQQQLDEALEIMKETAQLREENIKLSNELKIQADELKSLKTIVQASLNKQDTDHVSSYDMDAEPIEQSPSLTATIVQQQRQLQQLQQQQRQKQQQQPQQQQQQQLSQQQHLFTTTSQIDLSRPTKIAKKKVIVGSTSSHPSINKKNASLRNTVTANNQTSKKTTFNSNFRP